MMKHLAIAAAMAMAVCGCVSVKNDNSLVPPSGLYSDFKAPLTSFKEPLNLEGLKKGTARDNVYIHEWVYTGIGVTVWNATLKEAMEEAGITKLHYAEYSQWSFLGFYTRFEVTAYGE